MDTGYTVRIRNFCFIYKGNHSRHHRRAPKMPWKNFVSSYYCFVIIAKSNIHKAATYVCSLC